MVSDNFVQEHQEAMRRRLQDIMAFNKRKRIESSQKYIDEQKRIVRAQKFRQRRLEPEIVDILKPIAARHGLKIYEMTSVSRTLAANRARREGIIALYNAFPGRPNEWYTRPFGYARGSTNAIRKMFLQGTLPRPTNDGNDQ